MEIRTISERKQVLIQEGVCFTAVTLVGHHSSEYIGKFFTVYLEEIEETEE